ncbi:MAG: WYL domain-containing protein [Bacteroidales bacterium]|nr:WYL domain-containing protein [Bacteroidales bacterium]
MPTNKNALIRYMILDKKLSDRHHSYTCLDLLNEVNDGLELAGFPKIGGEDSDYTKQIKSGKRVIQKDLVDLQSSPFNMEIDSSDLRDGAPVYRYADPTASLFSTPLTDDEKRLLQEVLNTLGQFSGLDNFEWLEDLQAKLNDPSAFGAGKQMAAISPIAEENNAPKNKAIVFDSNPYLKNSNLLGTLYTHISNKQIIEVTYQPFGKPQRKYPVAPYQLRQYNNRWFLVCTIINTEDRQYVKGFYLNLPLDRIQEVKLLEKPAKLAHSANASKSTKSANPANPKETAKQHTKETNRPEDRLYEYIECADNLDEYYEDCIGITRYDDIPAQDIILAANETCRNYIETKPMHYSQTEIKDETTLAKLREQYPSLADHDYLYFYKLHIIPNPEMRRLILSYAPNLILLSPEEERNAVQKDIKVVSELLN